jgi:hypothetical protein
MRMRITVKPSGSRAEGLQVAADVRRDLWAHAPIEIDPDYPLRGTHRDTEGREYLEFSTKHPDEVRRVLQEYHHADRVEMAEAHEPLGEECLRCGNIAGPILPTVCPNCRFRDASPCPSCGKEIPRKEYISLGRRRFRCPNCRSRVRLRFNDPICLPDGHYNQPFVVVEAREVIEHDV